MSQDVESVASIRARAELRLDRHQRMMEVLTAALGRPRTVYAIALVVLGWVAANTVAKLIALVEELRRDLPMVKDRIDHEANAMQEAVDPHAMLEALERAAGDAPPKTG